MVPMKIKKVQMLFSVEGCTNCRLEYFLPLQDWVEKCAASGKPEMVKSVAETYLASIKKTNLMIRKDSIMICPHRTLRMLGEEMSHECQASENPVDKAWSKNVPIVYDMLKCFNMHTAHQMLLDKGDNLVYGGPLRLFKDEDFECLQDAKAVVQLMWSDHRTVESVLSSIELDQWDD
ncbi:hypothetical protein BDV33DRAFT_99763 [Aspergillus novoparasiticus]|uniref:Uncharacterized protein n=1 Tax=Aspergillus novoparasiticus TaxID=986946 RepID=A0A5N6E6L3_9EURO|nr:hypothetical protein BDV33DRAFT_99763 [Aspergillus novoparasiticus]